MTAVSARERRARNPFRWRDQPLRVQLVAVVVVMVLLALALSALATNLVLERSLTDRVDQQLTSEARRMSDVRDPGGRPPQGGVERNLPSQFFVARWDADGTVTVLADPRLDTDDYPDLADPGDVTTGEPTTVGSRGSKDRWRVLYEDTDDGGYVAVAMGLDEVTATLRELRWIEAAIAGVVLLALAVVSSWVVRRSLRPLAEVEATAQAIAAGDLAARVDTGLDPRTEVGALSASLDTMLGHIEAAVRSREEEARRAEESERRMRRFVADASHELRTPLTSIRGFAELYGQGAAADQATTDRFMSRIRQEADRMGVLVEDLLLLARLDQERPLRHDPVDLRELVRDAAVDARAVQPDRAVAGPAPGPPVVVEGDEARLRQVVGNLVSNVLVHTPPEAGLRLGAAVDGDDGVVTVSDDGPGLTADQAAHVFDRFYRADETRSRAAGGSGLGLAIVSALVAGHGGTVSLDTAPGEGATFTVRIPLAG
ncbi:HAMP domain-containing histidine kinase [Mumia sp. zg.B21]|uniref:HAMP domain-containing sensor histidine kinase n=1 Tax=Mumia sp. zg.B21 TaxID=2855447 RepID=UPI001C6F16DD|nr:HAMP domain-containing sensor histidine kinase [Mumia sp. zg.B21]MBW9210400.1 HAMP domain-containing histidine kinase [Mumia sp. zg.B21]